MTPPIDVYAREIVMARVGHLMRRKQREIERITRIVRACFDPEQVLAPEPGQIKRIILIGPYARRSWYEDRRTIDFSDSDLWLVVNHPLFPNDRCLQLARTVLPTRLGHHCALALGIYPISYIRFAHADRDTVIPDLLHSGLTSHSPSPPTPL